MEVQSIVHVSVGYVIGMALFVFGRALDILSYFGKLRKIKPWNKIVFSLKLSGCRFSFFLFQLIIAFPMK